MPNLLDTRPDLPLIQHVDYQTEVIIAHDGLEQRVGLRLKPRQRLEYRMMLPDETSIRKFRRDLFNDLGDTWQVPLWQDTVRMTAALAGGGTVVNGDFTLSDIMTGDDVLLLSPDELTFEIAEITATTPSSVILTIGSTNAYAINSAVVPIELAFAEDQSGYARRPTEVAELSLGLSLTTQKVLTGTGAPSITLHDTLNVLDRRPLNNSPEALSFFQGLTRIDFGNKFDVIEFGGRETKITRQKIYLANSRLERQYWKAFLDDVLGMREPFFVPTFRPDLVLSAQPAQGSATILVTDEPDYKVEYESSLAHQDLYLQTEGGDITRGIASSVDNLDGTITLTLDVALPNDPDLSTINVISFLERSRLASDRVTFQHFDTYTLVSISTQTIQQ